MVHFSDGESDDEDSLAKSLSHICDKKMERSFRKLCRQNQSLKGVEFVNYTPCTEAEVVQIYKTRVNKSKEEVIIDENVLDRKYSPFEVMFMLLLRLNQRFTLDEVRELESHHQVPLTQTHQDGSNNKWMSIMACQKLIKDWKKHRTKEFPIVSDEELQKLDRLAEGMKDDMQTLDEKAFFLYYTPQNVTSLPFLVGCLKVEQVGDLAFYPCVFTIDSAASSSILPLKMFKKLGYDREKLDKSYQVTVATACSKSTKAMGFYETRIYLRAQNKKFYWMKVNFLVLDCMLEDRILIGIRDLREAKQTLDSSKSVEFITLTVQNDKDSKVRKKFVTNDHLRPGKLTLTDGVPEFKRGKSDVLYTSDVYLTEHKKVYRPSRKGGRVNKVELRESVLKTKEADGQQYPEELSYVYAVRVKTVNRKKIEFINYHLSGQDVSEEDVSKAVYNTQSRDGPTKEAVSAAVCNTQSLYGHPEEAVSAAVCNTQSLCSHPEETVSEAVYNTQSHYGHPAEAPVTCLDPLENLPISPDLEGMTIENMTVGPPDIEVKDEKKWYLPEMSHLSKYWQGKYERLFYEYREVMAKSKYDFNQSNLPPVTIKLKSGVVPQRDACDTPRRYGPAELEILDSYIENLCKAGHVRPLRPEERSPFNHNLLLVYRQIPGEKAFVSSKADKANLSHNERVEMLRKSCRLCSDLKSLNKCVEPEGAMILQKFSESLPLFVNKVLSSADIKSGFNVIRLDDKSQMYTAFTHRDRQFVYVTLPMGLVTSPPLFQRRLGMALNAENFNKFKEEVNHQLKERENNPLLVWDCPSGWEGESERFDDPEPTGDDSGAESDGGDPPKWLQGPEWSAKIVRASEDELRQNYRYEPVLQCTYAQALQLYMDDLLLMSINQLNDYYTVWFVLYWLNERKVKLAASKFQLCPRNVTYLGYSVDTHKSTYGLTAERRANFGEWKFPTTREILTSRLCAANYFQSVLGSFKIITQCLHALVNAPVFHIKMVHRNEWEMLKLLIDLDLTYRIVDLTQPIILECDASFSSSSGAALQFLPAVDQPRGQRADVRKRQPNRHGGEGGSKEASESEAGDLEEEDQEREESPEPKFGLQLIGQFSKRFAKTDVAKNPLYKEVLGLLACVREFEVYIRNTTAFTVLFTDASSLSFIVRQRHVNSRLANVALYLSSFPCLSVMWTAGGKMNFLSDWLGKQYCGMAVKEASAIPAKYLDAIPQLNLPPTHLTPAMLQQILAAPMPSMYLDIPERRRQAKSDLMTAEDFRKLLDQKPVETQTLQALLFGLHTLPVDSLAFQRNDRKGLISNTEFEGLRRRMDPGELKQRFEYIMVHSHHVETLGDLKEMCLDWVKSLIQFMDRNPDLRDKEPSLYDSARHLRLTAGDDYKSQFLGLLDNYQHSSLYNHEYEHLHLHPVTFIATGISHRSEMTVRGGENRLKLFPRVSIRLIPEEAKVIMVQISFKTKYSLSIQCKIEECIFQPVINVLDVDAEVYQILIMNKSQQDVIISPETCMFEIIFHKPYGDTCGCEINNEVRFVVQTIPQDDGFFVPTTTLPVEVMLTQSIAGPGLNPKVGWGSLEEPEGEADVHGQGQILSPEGTIQDQDGEPIEMEDITASPDEDILVETDSPTESERLRLTQEGEVDSEANHPEHTVNRTPPPMSPEAHNRMVLATMLLTREESVFTPAQFKSLQQTDPYLVSIIEKVNKGKNKSFELKNGILFYTKDGRHRLCLDRNTAGMICAQMHALQRHYTLDCMVQYLSSYFFCKDLKAVCRQEAEKCSACVFNQPCRKVKFVQNPDEKAMPAPWESVSVDLDESFPRSGSRYKFIMLFVDDCTGFLVACAMKQATSREAVDCFKQVIGFYGPMKRVKTDFGPLFRGKEFRSFLSKWHIRHEKEVPKRACSNGRAERMVATYRHMLMKILTQEVGSNTRLWDRYLWKSTLLFNSASLFSRHKEVLSRHNLFFGSLRYSPNWLVHSNDLTGDPNEKQIEAMDKIFKIRQAFRSKYKTMSNPFLENQIVIAPLAKDEFPSINGERGGQPTVQQLFKVVKPLHSGCQVISLTDKSKSVLNLEDMKPCPVEQVENLFNKDLTALGSFDRGIFKVGDASAQIFRDLFPENRPLEPITPAKVRQDAENRNEIENQSTSGSEINEEVRQDAPTGRDEPTAESDGPSTETDGEESDGDIGEEEDRGTAAVSPDAGPGNDLDNHTSEEEEDQRTREATPVSEQWETADDPNPALPIKYNLRPRNKKANYVFMIEEGPYVKITSNPMPDLEPILTKERRRHNLTLSFAKERRVAFLNEEDHLIYSPTMEHFVFVVEGAAGTWGRLPFDKTISKREVNTLYRAKLKRNTPVKD